MIKTSVYNLTVGMYVAKLDRNWLDTSFFRHSFLIKDQKLLERLKTECDFVFIDPAKSVSTTNIKQQNQIDAINAAKLERNKAKKILVQFFDKIQRGDRIDSHFLINFIGTFTNKILCETESYLYLNMLEEKDNSLAEKSIRVFVFFLVFAKHIGVKKTQLLDIAIAAMLHDVGMLSAPKELLNSAFISKNERKYIENHTKIGVDILKKENTFSELILNTIKHHHENIDGSGYPSGLKGREISLYSRMLNITCMFEALTRNRVYRKAVSPIEAIKSLVHNINTKLDHRLTLRFIEAMGLYPPGSIISLKNDAQFKVLSYNPKTGYSVVENKLTNGTPAPLIIQAKDIEQLISC
ncbi:HD-GYP domain-containing protein [Thalassotalea sp. G2M2-11]|uniref:HD-GYP domain-containing protein n=1 Tax=Thalassotalea sp. G2M2-11 TaxID=2787627 RepID=UPI0019D0587C|nr:HD-GYP domain-containing protein [Thalassotalea sp. G2M2-11]